MRIALLNRWPTGMPVHYALARALRDRGAEVLAAPLHCLQMELEGASAIVRLGGVQLDADVVVNRVSENDFCSCEPILIALAERMVVVNAPAPAAVAADKWRTQVVLAQAGVSTVPTTFSPTSAMLREYPPTSEGRCAGYAGWVAKSPWGAGGRSVRYLQASEEASEATLTQPFAAAGHNGIRVLVLQGRAVCAIRRLPKRESESAPSVDNIEAGGEPDPVSLTRELASLAEGAVRAIVGLTVAAVDIVTLEHREAVLEVNGSPGLDGLQRAHPELDIWGLYAGAVMADAENRFGRVGKSGVAGPVVWS
jgi:ribosomal protein S6--L-glutamate ligase